MSTTAVYTHDSKGHRVDVHAPSNIVPGDYEYRGVKVNRKDPVKGGPAGTCHHCGKAIVWEVLWLHRPSGNLVTFGEICTQILGMSDSRIEHEMVLLKRRAENERAAERAKMEKQEKIDAFKAEQPEVVKFLTDLDANDSFYFLVEMKRSLDHWGGLTERQVASVKKCMVARESYNARKIQEAIDQSIAGPTPELQEGRRVIEGEVASHKWQESMYGDTHKMLVKQDDGNKVWVTVPREISDYVHENDVELKGLRVRFTATVERSKTDDNFGFGSRPSKASVVV